MVDVAVKRAGRDAGLHGEFRHRQAPLGEPLAKVHAHNMPTLGGRVNGILPGAYTPYLDVPPSHESGHGVAMNAPNNIKALRESAGLSMAQLAELVGTSDTQINKLEKGERRLTEDWMRRLARALKVQPVEIMRSTTPPVRSGVVVSQHPDELREVIGILTRLGEFDHAARVAETLAKRLHELAGDSTPDPTRTSRAAG